MPSLRPSRPFLFRIIALTALTALVAGGASCAADSETAEQGSGSPGGKGGSSAGGKGGAAQAGKAGASAGACTPGTTQLCFGPGACQGAQTCASGGDRWESCDCGAGQGGASGSSGQGGAGGSCPAPVGPGSCESPIGHLVSWWHADAKATAGPWKFLDATGRLSNVLIPGTLLPEIVPGKQGGAWKFDGDSGIEVSAPLPHIPLKAFSIEGWIAPSGPGPIMSKITPGTGDGVLLDVNISGNGELVLRFVVGITIYSPPDKPLLQKKMNHIAATYDGSNMKLYINGVLVTDALALGVKGIPSQLSENGKPLRIGADFAEPPVKLKSIVDELKLYDVALSAEQVQADFLGQGCTVRDPIRWDFSNAQPPTPVPPYYEECGYSGSVSTAKNGSYEVEQGLPFKSNYILGADAHPFFKLDIPEPFSLDRLTFWTQSNPQFDFDTMVEISQPGETNPLGGNFKSLGSYTNHVSEKTTMRGPFSAGVLQPGSYLVRLRPTTAPSPGTTWTDVNAIYALGHNP